MEQLTTNEMLRRLTKSKNLIVADKATKLLTGELNREEEMETCGGFLKLVLEGKFEDAYRKADLCNRRAFDTPTPLVPAYRDHTIAVAISGEKAGKVFVPEFDVNFFDEKNKVFKYFDNIRDIVDIIDAIETEKFRVN